MDAKMQEDARVEESFGSAASLTLRDLTKHFDSLQAVEKVNIEVKGGEFLTFLGPSGSGKTTTLNMIAGFLDPTAGEILIDEERVTAPPHKRDIGMVFQNYALFPHMTAAENVGFPLKVRRTDKDQAKKMVAEILDMVGLAGRGENYPKQLSGGQQQRIALARALVFRPKIVLLDEPLGALDKKLRDELQLELKRIQEELRVTMIYVTHDQEEALVMSDRIAVFNNGEIEQLGGAEELYERPQSLFVAEFLGESNVFRGELTGRSNKRCLSTNGFELAVQEGSELNDEDSQAALVIRPERLRISGSKTEPEGDENMIEATVQEVIYLGSERKYNLTTSDGTELISRHQVGTIRDEPRTGDEVNASWKTEHGVLLPDPSQTDDD